MRAEGTFTVAFHAEPPYDDADGVTLGRMRVDKVFTGPLAATSTVHMLSARNLAAKSGAYVAVERITGTLDGRAGSFVVTHVGVSDRGANQLRIDIVPDTGAGALTGIRGAMEIRIADGVHHYAIDYTLP